MARFLLLLHRPAGTPPGDPEQMRERVGRYRAWREEMTRAGKILAGEKLTEDRGRWLRADAHGGPVAEQDPGGNGGQSVISGYFLLQADDYEEAAELAGRCPHIAYGGTIELRQIEST